MLQPLTRTFVYECTDLALVSVYVQSLFSTTTSLCVLLRYGFTFTVQYEPSTQLQSAQSTAALNSNVRTLRRLM